MQKLNAIEESQYKVDFEILKGYLEFSSELLRLSLLAMGGFGALVLIKLKGETKQSFPAFLQHPELFLISMALFAACAAATLFHRYFASDSMSWYIAWLRAEAAEKKEKAEKERKGFYKMLKCSEWSLILSEIFFGSAVLFFIVAVFQLFAKQ